VEVLRIQEGPILEPRKGGELAWTCGQCEIHTRMLYVLPETRRLGERAPRVVCRFCYIRLAGINPRRRELVIPGPAPA
jgi:hypothetical protein